MTSRLVLVLTAALVLACGGGGTEAPPQPEPPAPEPEKEPELDGFAYVPGPGGKAAGARFSRFAAGEAVYIGVDDANVRDPSGADDVVATLPLGAKVTVVEALGEPVELIDRRNVWYRVRLEDGREGRIFGAILTPLGGRAWLSERDEGDRGWGLTFSPEGMPRLRVDEEPGSSEALTLDLAVTERFQGGRLEASTEGFGDFETHLQVSMCRLDGGEAPECSSAVVRLGDDLTSLEQISPPDPWRFAPDPSASRSCSGGTALPVQLAESTGEPVITLKTPAYMRGDDGSVECFGIGRVKDGKHRGKELVSCVTSDGGKSAPAQASVARYLRDSSSWTYLPCASNVDSGDIDAALVNQRIQVRVDADVSAPAALEARDEVEVSKGSLTLLYHAPSLGSPDLVPLFEANGVSYSSVSGVPYAIPDHAIVVAHPDGTALVYAWAPDLTWDSDPPGQDYTSQTLGCSGTAEIALNLDDAVSDDDLERFGTLSDGTVVSRLKDPDHPRNRELVSWYVGLAEQDEYTRPQMLELGLTPEELLAGNPWLYLNDPWGRRVRLIRKDMEIPAMCEPILYVYADPPEPVSIRPMAPLRFHRTRPEGPNGWTGVAQPDGSVVVDGRAWPELFWEGRSFWFAPPRDSVVVGERDVERFLTRALDLQGLTLVEREAFLNAWLPDLSGRGALRIGFHRPEDIDRIAPLDVEPEPDVFLRVLMDAAPTDADPDPESSWPRPATPDRKGRLVAVEWGGILR
ncbi:MAG: SH3 domain-containing protein [Myxococcota bacterium]